MSSRQAPGAPRKRHNPIINARRRLHWRQRFFSNASTALMWGMFLYMWRPLLHIMIWFGGLHAWVQLLQYTGLIDSPGEHISLIEDILPAVYVVALFLMLWSRLPTARTNAGEHPMRDADYARHFGIDERALAALRETRISVVHHDDHGHITGFDSQDTRDAG